MKTTLLFLSLALCSAFAADPPDESALVSFKSGELALHGWLWKLIEDLRPVMLSEAIAYVAVYAGTPSPNQKASLLQIGRANV